MVKTIKGINHQHFNPRDLVSTKSLSTLNDQIPIFYENSRVDNSRVPIKCVFGHSVLKETWWRQGLWDQNVDDTFDHFDLIYCDKRYHRILVW